MVNSYSIIFAATAVVLAATPSLAMAGADYDVTDYTNEMAGRDVSDSYIEAREPEL